MPIDVKELINIHPDAASSRIRYVRLLEEHEIVAFFQGLLRTTVEAKDGGDWEKVSRYLEEWEDRVGHTLLLGRHAYDGGPWTPLSKPLSQCRVAIVTTGGVYVEGDEPFNVDGDISFRLLPKETPPDRFRIAHTHYDTSGVLDDVDTVFPVNVLKDLEAEGVIGCLADINYGFMGFIPRPEGLIAETAPVVARRLKADGVDAVLIPTT